MSDSPRDGGQKDGRSGTAQPWRPAIAVQFSIAIHLAALLALLFRPAWWPWVGAALVANHLALGLIGMWPRSRLLGDNIIRLPDAAARRGEIALTFDDGPHPEVTPKVLDILDRYGATASFFCVGDKAAAHPDIVRESSGAATVSRITACATLLSSVFTDRRHCGGSSLRRSPCWVTSPGTLHASSARQWASGIRCSIPW